MNLEFDENTYQVQYGDAELVLLPKEFDLFRFFRENPNRVWSREELLSQVWAQEDPVDRTVDDHVYRIRKKLRQFRIDGPRIETVRGRGYRYIDTTFKTVSEPQYKPNNAILSDPDFNGQVRAMFEQFVLFGYGDGLKLLLLKRHRFP